VAQRPPCFPVFARSVATLRLAQDKLRNPGGGLTVWRVN